MKVAIPRMGECVAPCFEYSATIAIFTIEKGHIVGEIEFPLRSRDPFDRVRLLRDQDVDTIICGGLQDVYEQALRASGIQVISWVSGSVSELLRLFLRSSLPPKPSVRDLSNPARAPRLEETDR